MYWPLWLVRDSNHNLQTYQSRRRHCSILNDKKENRLSQGNAAYMYVKKNQLIFSELSSQN